ncbi:nuclear transport factor 2 family protein [Seongchinamella sediminis]|uniref:Nuclear transport factor 2 family protein n=1 Tax=Seongchinamella sediminis TaxID=2283635 RepID=A0A3L7DUE7_9GAMM|nr:nuclear transport factor 2 family protein [Seongchinamella sediminis]RLQ20405.1 nuclear transport factor 2 family protein [Seongchinamella sediminis]
MLSQQELSDRLEIQDLVYRYAELVDSKQLDALRSEVFTEDAHIDYSAMGGSVGNVDETLDFLKASLTDELFPASQHLNANIQVRVDGDGGTGRVMCFNPMVMAMPDGQRQTILMGLWYLDQYRRTPAGWRISRREEVKSWVFNAPDFMNL